MSTTTIAEAIMALLESNWSLAAPLTAADIHFDCGWLDRQWLAFSRPSPQIIVSGPIASPNTFYGKAAAADAGLHLFAYNRYVVNVWVRLGAGEVGGGTHPDTAELLRDEVVKIINEHRCDIVTPAGITFLLPLDRGRALHELNMSPRVLRYEITVQVNQQT